MPLNSIIHNSVRACVVECYTSITCIGQYNRSFNNNFFPERWNDICELLILNGGNRHAFRFSIWSIGITVSVKWISATVLRQCVNSYIELLSKFSNGCLSTNHTDTHAARAQTTTLMLEGRIFFFAFFSFIRSFSSNAHSTIACIISKISYNSCYSSSVWLRQSIPPFSSSSSSSHSHIQERKNPISFEAN